eukprot:4007249-Pyramimonas_sp.AAC.1
MLPDSRADIVDPSDVADPTHQGEAAGRQQASSKISLNIAFFQCPDVFMQRRGYRRRRGSDRAARQTGQESAIRYATSCQFAAGTDVTAHSWQPRGPCQQLD